jgi:hypothetical protein
MIKFSRGISPTLCLRGVLLALVWGYCYHIAYIFHILPYICVRAWGHKNAEPGWSQVLFSLNEFLLGTA